LPREVIEELIQNGLLIHQRDTLKVTSQGRLLLNSVTEKLLLS
jgi:coproporphyrinogen III oxidase-like Fe-S oxidoreductase